VLLLRDDVAVREVDLLNRAASSAGRIVEEESPASVRVTWANASAVKTRCGARADAELVFGPSLLPPSYWNCGRYNPFAGGSADGECPISNVCVAAILGVQMICESDDDACLAVAESFATTSP
jgi:hypothetical protein